MLGLQLSDRQSRGLLGAAVSRGAGEGDRGAGGRATAPGRRAGPALRGRHLPALRQALQGWVAAPRALWRVLRIVVHVLHGMAVMALLAGGLPAQQQSAGGSPTGPAGDA